MECKRKNRLVIYTFQDRQGIVDRYVIHYLQEMKKYADHILVVVNGNITPEGHRKLALVTSEILVREDTGFYASGYQAGMIHFGWDKLKQYDEVVLTNDSLMGPVCSFD